MEIEGIGIHYDHCSILVSPAKGQNYEQDSDLRYRNVGGSGMLWSSAGPAMHTYPHGNRHAGIHLEREQWDTDTPTIIE